jgi:outer membrane protein assembly factor BamD (BamD/ComL family)
VDFITGLPENNGCNAILTVCCRKTKQVHAIPTTTETSAASLAKLYQDHVWRLRGMLETTISNGGPQFAANFMRELARLLEIKLKIATAYHPQTDGQTEEMNQELEQYLRLFVNHHQSDWVQWLPVAEFSYNNKIQTSMKVTPFFANYGFHPRMGFKLRRKTKIEAMTDFVERMKKVHEESDAALIKA